MILLLLILMMGIPLDMIQIEVILQTAPHLLQKTQIAQQQRNCEVWETVEMNWTV